MSRLIKKEKPVILRVSLLLLVFLFICCNKKDEPGVSSKIIIGIGRDLYFGPSSPTFLHGSLNVWEGLTSLNDRLEPRPQLAESWESKNRHRLWVLHLREGVCFHDGKPLDSEVIVENIERMKRNPKFDIYGTYKNVRSVDAQNSLTVDLFLHRPDPVFPSRLSYFGSPIFSSGSIDSNGRVIKPIGTGPFIFQNYVKGESITLKRSDRYYLGSARLEEVVFKFIPDPATRVFALKAGEIDAVLDIGGILPEQVSLLRKDNGIKILTQEVATTHYLFFNTRRLPFSSLELRMAVSLAIDRKEIAETIFEGYARAAREFFTPLAKTWIPNGYNLLEDRIMAKKLVEKAPDFSGKIIFAVNAGLAKRWPYKPISEVIQSYLKDIGLNVKICMLEMGAWKDALKRGDFDISLSPNTLMTGDPDFFFSPWIHSSGQLNIDQGILYKNPVADNLIEKARIETDLVTRREMYYKLHEIVGADLPLTPLFHDITIYACRKGVEDLRLDAFFKPSLHMAWTVDR